jgi:hypothetical protein
MIEKQSCWRETTSTDVPPSSLLFFFLPTKQPGKGAKKSTEAASVTPVATEDPSAPHSAPHVSIEMVSAGGSSATDPAAAATAVAATPAVKSGGGGGHGHGGGNEEQQASPFWLAACFTMLMGSGIIFGMVRVCSFRSTPAARSPTEERRR